MQDLETASGLRGKDALLDDACHGLGMGSGVVDVTLLSSTVSPNVII